MKTTGVRSGAARWLALVVLFVGALGGCVPYSLRAVLDGPKGMALSLNPASVVLAASGAITFTASGGVPPYTYALLSGGGTLDSSTGVYLAPSTPGAAVIQVTDATGRTATTDVSIRLSLYVITAVPVPAGSQTGLPVSGTFTIQNSTATAGTANVSWQVYASPGSSTIGAGAVLLDSNSTAGVPAGGSASPSWSGTWPAAPGTYYVVVRASAGDSAPIADAASAAISVTAPPAPDYTASFSAGIPWTGLVNTSMSSTGTCQVTIQNLNANAGHADVTWSVYLSTSRVLDASATLIQQGTIIGGLAASGSSVQTFAGNWPAAAGTYYFIALVQASDDSNPTNDTVAAPHPCVTGDFRHVEVKPNGGVGPALPTPNDPTGVTLSANMTLVIEGTIDVYNAYNTYAFATDSTMTKMSIRALWHTGFDDINLWLWDSLFVTNLASSTPAPDSEPGGTTWTNAVLTPRTCYVSAYNYLNNNTTTSTGQPYVIVVRGLP